ncbi:MAG: DUF2330 domain-containing protein [Leptolyngbya sp. SIOISBB]|nr:DUF2330 domain-containing protein [Leptolyngbya sp. SIOISBB]
MKHWLRYWKHGLLSLVTIAPVVTAPEAGAFPGVYVAGADAQLTSREAHVAITRDGNQTTLTLLSDYTGDVGEFALIVPVPAEIRPEQVQVVDPTYIKRMAFFSSPATHYVPWDCVALCIEYPPCGKTWAAISPVGLFGGNLNQHLAAAFRYGNLSLLGIEGAFTYFPIGYELFGRIDTTGEFSVSILNSQNLEQLAALLAEQDYTLSPTVRDTLQTYFHEGMSFVVAEITIPEFEAGETYYPHPLQITYDSPQFELPIQLGKLNSPGEQNLSLYLLSSKGRAEIVNYRTAAIPTEETIPEWAVDLRKKNFGDVYRAILAQTLDRAGHDTVLIESVFSLQNFAPLIDQPMQYASARDRLGAATVHDLQNMGVNWISASASNSPLLSADSADVFFTGLQLQYAPDDFSEDLVFYETSDPQRFEVIYNFDQYPSAGPELNQAAVACAENIIDEWQRRHASQLEHDRQHDENLTSPDFPTFLREEIAHLADPNSREFELLADDYKFVDPANFPFFDETEDPFEYIFHLSQITHTQHEAEVIRRLEEESRTLARLTGWSLYEIRQRMTAEHRSVPESWRQQYPDPDDAASPSVPADNDL